MRTVHKFKIEPDEGTERVRIKLPAFAEILHVGAQDGEAFIWAEVDTDMPLQDREFEVYPTGKKLFEERHTYLQHIGTFFPDAPAAGLVFHLFERKVKE